MFALALACAGCQFYDPALLDAAVDAGGIDGGPCALRRPPARPTGADAPDQEELVFSLKEVVLDQGGEAWRDIGYDVDGLCSVPPEPVVECVPPSRTADPEVDGNNGIDNVFGHLLFPLVEVTVPDLEVTARAAQEEGIGNPVLRLRGWNGADDDPHVEVVISQAVFGTPGDGTPAPPAVTVGPDGPRLPDGGTPPPPAWMGDDWFWVRDDTFFMGDEAQPLVRDDNAYVAGRVLVITLPDRIDVIFTAETEGLLVRLTDARASGRISADGTMLEDVTVAGRWSVLDLLMTASAIGVCPGSAEHRILVSQLERIADVRSTPGTGGAGVACDAVSLGVEFTGYRAHWAGLAPAPPLPNLCPDAGM